ncbi:MAG: hypothetical protein L6R42_002334 [Xanthoria sp. 1 TBL-2021]|nr:MAG: hypothetical protein L6R42_002334 [Xanthoria sp. 1 TBL-2021]
MVSTDPDSRENRMEKCISEPSPQRVALVAATSLSTPASKGETSEKTTRKPLSFYLAFLSLNICVFLVSLDATALAVAIPRITQDLHGTTLEAFWTNLSFILAVAITQPIFANISDVLGRKIPLYASFLLFFVGSIIFAVANNMAVLIAGRVVQGLGAGGLDVLGEVILVDMTTLKERPLYLGLFSLPMAGGGVCGPIIGAAFSEYVDWRWIGWMNLPIIALGVVLAFFFLHLRSIDRSFRSKIRDLDWIGMVLYTVGSVLFALPLSWAGPLYRWSSWRTTFPLSLGVVILIAFGIFESKPTKPVFPYRIFRNRTAVVTLIGATIHGVLLYSVLLYAPLFFQAVLLETPFRSAISVLPAGASIVGFSILSVIVIEALRRYRWTIIGSWLCATSGVGLWALWHPYSSSAAKYGLQILAGVGIGALFTVLTIPMQASVADVDDMGIAAGILVSFRLFGGLSGLAVCATVFNNVFERRVGSIGSLPPSLDHLRDGKEAVAFIPVLRSLDSQLASLAQVIDAYRISLMAVFLTLAGVGAIGCITSIWTKELTLEKEELGEQRLERSP